MNIALPILLLFIAGALNEIYAQAIPRFLWTPVVKPYEFLPKVNGSNPKQKTFGSKANTANPFTEGTPYLVTEVGSIIVNGTVVSTVDTFWVYPKTSNHRVGLSAKKPFVIEGKVMNRSYIDPTTNKSVVLSNIPNEHSSKSGVRAYNPNDELLYVRLFGNYFINPSVNVSNLGVNLNVTNNIFNNPTFTQNLISTRNIREVMKLGDYRAKVRMINRYPFLPPSYLFTLPNGVLVQ